MPSSKRVTGNFNFWTGNTGNWSYANAANTGNVTNIRRGTSDTRFYSSNLEVYGNIVSLGGDIYANLIYANIAGNIVVTGGVPDGVLYKNPIGDAAIASDYFIVDVANNSANIVGNFRVSGAGKGNLVANNIVGNVATVTFVSLGSANIGTANIAANGNASFGFVRAQGYLNTAGANVLYGNANVFSYLGSNSNIILNIGTGNISTAGFVTVGSNVTASYFIGNGSQLTGLPASYGNANVAAYLPTYTGNLASLAGNVTTTANVSGAYILGNGAFLSGIAGGGSNYSNANVANYLPVYNGSALFSNILTTTANITGSAQFSNVANLRIPGGTLNQVMKTDGNGNISFGDVVATPGNNVGSFQYNNNGNLYGLDDFVYVYTGNLDPRLQLTNLNFTIDKDTSNANVQLTVIGNIAVNESPSDANTGYIQIGGIDRLVAQDLSGNGYTGQFVVVDGNAFNYANGYANSNTALYLPTYTGNLVSLTGNVITTANISGNNVSTGTITLTNGAVIKDTAGNAVAFGRDAAATGPQGNAAVAIGQQAGDTSQGTGAVAIGDNAGAASQGQYAVAVGAFAGNNAQGMDAVAVGLGAGNDTQGIRAVAVGREAGYITQGNAAVAVGEGAGLDNQGEYSVAIGQGAGITAQGNQSVAIGQNAGTTQGTEAVAIGLQAGFASQGNYAVAIGKFSANSNQGTYAVAVGPNAGFENQLANAVAIGSTAGASSQGINSVAIGVGAAYNTQGNSAVAVGNSAGYLLQGLNSVAIGDNAGFAFQGANSIAIGALAGNTNQATNSIILNATGGVLDQTTANTFTVAPVRNTSGNAGILQYNDGTNEVSYSSNVTGNLNVIGGNISGNTAGFTIGYRDIPQVSFTGNATTAASDAGKHYYSTLATANTLTIANNTSVSWAVGTILTVVNRGSGNITIAQGSGVSLYLAGNSTAGNRTVSTYGMASLLNVAANIWMINGTGVA